MKLERVEVRNYRSLFHDTESPRPFVLNLGEGMNSIAGPNNVGKSNVLRALALALDPDCHFDRVLDMPAPRTWSKPTIALTFRVPERGRPSRERTLLRRLEDYERAVDPSLVKTYASEGIVKLRVFIEGGEESAGSRREVFVTRGAGARSLPDDHDLAVRARSQFHSCFHFVMIRSGESLTSLMEGKFRDILHNVLRDDLAAEYEAALESRSNYSQNLQGGLLRDLTDRISRQVTELFPEISSVSLEPQVRSLDATLSQMRVSVSDAATTDLADKGTGVRGGLIVAMLRHFTEVSNRSMLFAVEEPESFLHPAAQEQLREDLEALSERNDVSLMVTTHSPYIVSRRLEAKVFALDKGHDGRTIVHGEAVGTDSRAGVLGGLFRDRLFIEWLDRAQQVAADVQLTLVVEGYTDRRFAELALERAGRADLLEGIAFIEAGDGMAPGAGGASLAVMQALVARSLRPASAKVAVLLDNDKPGCDAEQTLKEVGSKTGDWKQGSTLFSYRDVFEGGNKRFAYEAEDLWSDRLHERFLRTHKGAGGWLRRTEKRPKPEGGTQYDWHADAKGPLLQHLEKHASRADCDRWVALYEHIRKRAGLATVG